MDSAIIGGHMMLLLIVFVLFVLMLFTPNCILPYCFIRLDVHLHQTVFHLVVLCGFCFSLF